LGGAVGNAAIKLDWGLDLSQSYHYQEGYDLNEDNNNPIATRGDVADTRGVRSSERAKWFHTLMAFNGTGGVKGLGGGDVTLNFRLAAQFDWFGTQVGGPDQNSLPGSGGTLGTSTVDSQGVINIWINKLNVKFEDFAGLPIDLTFGRQAIKLGRGFVLGSRLIGGGPTFYASGQAPSGSCQAGACTGQNGQTNAGYVGNLPAGQQGGSNHDPRLSDAADSFDAVTLDFRWKSFYMNWGYALIASAFTQSATGATAGAGVRRDVAGSDEEFLGFFNFGYKSRKWLGHPWTVEAYYLANIDKEPMTDSSVGGLSHDQWEDQIYTIGTRFDMDLRKLVGTKNINIFGEVASQFGTLGAQRLDGVSGRDRDGWALNLGATASFKHKYSPWFGGEYVFYSGPGSNQIEPDNGAFIDVEADVAWSSWDPQFRSVMHTLIIDVIDLFYLTDQLASDGNAQGGNVVNGRVDSPITNRHMFLATVGFKPFRKVDTKFVMAYARLDESPYTISQENKSVGWEVDGFLNYKFSKAIDWNLNAGFFRAGGYYQMPSNGNKRNAWTVNTGFTFSL